ncbi:MAG: GNAT family N-acetyltransferase [Candidatus Syntrophosphaera sp.]|nr:GNAT family N-acetyltransferase [Candidatus Syntrophosphaera sp.]
MSLDIRRSQQLDRQLFADITAIWLETGISNPARADDFDSVQYNLDNGGIMLLASLDGVLAGTAWLSHDFRRIYIHHMAVARAQQNKGIGRRLLMEALEIAREQGWQAKLEVHADNAAARHLYASCGFTDLEGYITMILRG